MRRNRWLEATAVARVEPWVLAFACVPAVAIVFSLLRAFVVRASYGGDVELMEGGSLLAAYRLMHHLPVYTDPGSGFMPFVYTPLHMVVLAGLGSIFGLTFTLGRVLSILFVLVFSGVLGHEVYEVSRKMSYPWVWVVLSLGFIAVGYPLTAGAYDIVRVDSFALMLAIACGAVAVSADIPISKNRLSILVVLVIATIYTKQSHILLSAWVVLFVALRSPKAGIWLAVWSGLGSLSILLLLDRVTHDNFRYYTVDEVRKHAIFLTGTLGGAIRLVEFAPYLPVILLTAAFLRLKKKLSSRSSFWVAMLLFALPVSLLGYAKLGGSVNTLIPAVVLPGPVALCVFCDLLAAIPAGSSRSFVRIAGAALGAFYIWARSFDTTPYVPGPERFESLGPRKAFIAGLHGSVLFPMRPFSAILAGRTFEQIHAGSWYDLWFTGEVRPLFRRFLERTNPRWIILTGEEPANIVRQMSDFYLLAGLSPPDTWKADVLPYGGQQPLQVLTREVPDPPGTRCLFDFESGGYSDFVVEGDAFRSGPYRFRPALEPYLFALQGVIVGAEGSYIANSAGGPLGDAATGTLTSPEFVLDGATLHLRVAGSDTRDARVELVVDDNVVQVAFGHASNYMQDIGWDIAPYRGKRARLRLVDEATLRWGHILVDKVRIFGSNSISGWCKR